MKPPKHFSYLNSIHTQLFKLIRNVSWNFDTRFLIHYLWIHYLVLGNREHEFICSCYTEKLPPFIPHEYKKPLYHQKALVWLDHSTLERERFCVTWISGPKLCYSCLEFLFKYEPQGHNISFLSFGLKRFLSTNIAFVGPFLSSQDFRFNSFWIEDSSITRIYVKQVIFMVLFL